MSLYEPAISETLDAIADDEEVREYGFANVGNCDGYFVVTDRGVHYCESEKAGFMKKRYASRFYPRSDMRRAVIDQISGPSNAYLRIFDQNDKMSMVMWFQAELSRGDPLTDAKRAAAALELE